MTGGLLLVMLLISSGANVVVTPGALIGVPQGYVVSNLDPAFNSPFNNEIYDPNFIPGFGVGLTNISVSWNSGNGYANLGYSIGPWAHEQTGIPHLAVGPQCCNFKEVPHTQQFRRVEWGDYYYVKAGFGPPGVNVENYTTDFSAPAYVGLRTDWKWTVQLALNWKPPVMMNPSNEWGAIGIAATQFVPSAPGKLVYTLVNFWMDRNSSSYIAAGMDGNERRVVPPTIVAYHPVQVSSSGNETVTLSISPYLEDTLRVLGLQTSQNQPPVISYTYLNVEGYNFGWNATLWSFKVMSQQNDAASIIPFVLVTVAVALVASVVLVYRARRRTLNPSREGDEEDNPHGYKQESIFKPEALLDQTGLL